MLDSHGLLYLESGVKGINYKWKITIIIVKVGYFNKVIVVKVEIEFEERIIKIRIGKT
jgi:hypothetical protein